jgi:hypothetical protein
MANTVKGSARKGKRVTHSPKAHPSSAPSHAGGVPGGTAGGGTGKGAAQSNLKGHGNSVLGKV